MTDRERETLPPGAPCPFGNDKAPILDPGVKVIGDLVDSKLNGFLADLGSKIEQLTGLVTKAVDQAMVNHELLQESVRKSNEALSVSRDNQHRIEDIERRLNG